MEDFNNHGFENNNEEQNSQFYSNIGDYYYSQDNSNIFQDEIIGKRKKKKDPKHITVKVFIISLIFAMLATSGLTIAGITIYDSIFAPGSNQATNYELSKSTKPMSYKNVISKVSDSVVSIATESISTDIWAENYVTKGAGSGVIIQSNGYIMTCNHVISGASKITVTLKDKRTYNAKLVGSNSDNDLAILKISATKLPTAKYGDSSKLQVGDEVVAIGNPLGELSHTATTGIVSALDRKLTIEGKTMNLLQTDASINPGNSGGALFDTSGLLIGIVDAKSSGSDVEGLGFAIPINKAAKLGKQLIETGEKAGESKNKGILNNKNRAVIGVTVQEVSEEQAKDIGLDSPGVYIREVNTPSANASGLKAGDRIIKVDGKEIKSISDLTKILRKHKPNDNVRVQGERDGKKFNTGVKLSAATN